MSTLKLIISSTFVLTLLCSTGCNDTVGNSKTSPVSETPREKSSDPKANPPKPPTPQKDPIDPVEEFRAFARATVAALEDDVKDERFKIQSGRLEVIARIEIDSDYSVDVKTSDSLISPYVGEIKLKSRHVYDELLGVKDAADNWVTVVIECGYQDGRWQVNTELSEQLMRIEPLGPK